MSAVIEIFPRSRVVRTKTEQRALQALVNRLNKRQSMTSEAAFRAALIVKDIERDMGLEGGAK